MFHSLGTIQSKTRVPVGTSRMVRGTSRPRRLRVSRNPSPVMLRQIGYSSAINRYISAPRFSGTGFGKNPASIWLRGIYRTEVGIASIALVQDLFPRWPGDSEGRIVPPDAARVVGPEELGDQVKDLGAVFERLESVCAALRHVGHTAVFGRERRRRMFPEGRGGGPKIENDVVDRPPRAADDFHFRMRRKLIVQAPQRSLPRVERLAALGDSPRKAALFEVTLAPEPREKAALVRDWFRFDQEGPGDFEWLEDHAIVSTRGIGTTKRPPQSRTRAICPTISSFRFQGSMST